MTFHGAKCALFLGQRLVAILRDDRPDIAAPNMWDLPGGGREGNETPFETVSREIKEEIGLVLSPNAVLWEARFPGVFYPGTTVAFFVAQMPEAAVDQIVFGDEGQCWMLMSEQEFVSRPNVISSYEQRLARWRAETGGLPA